MILAGDVGGTKTNLGLFATEPAGLRLLRLASYHSAAFPGLEAVVRVFLAAGRSGGGASRRRAEEIGAPPAWRAEEIAAPPPSRAEDCRAACFGVAGPVIDNRTSTPNLAWKIDGRRLAAELGLPAVVLINDLVATAAGIPLLQPGELAILQAGARSARRAGGRSGNRVLIAAGTGLGMALLPEIGGVKVVVASEGGHADYSPRGSEECELLAYLRRRFAAGRRPGHVSVERVVSGPGLWSIYEFLRDTGTVAESPRVRAALAKADDPSRVVSEAGLGGDCPLCSRALDLFVAAYGAAAGNLALLGTATGGVFVGGGIAPKILPRLADGAFVRAFADKGRFARYLRRIPVHVILNEHTAILGAARSAAALAAGG